VDVDEELAAQLTLAQRVHALQIAREAVSNALRHGHATHIGIALRRHGEFAEFEVVDDGQGFDVGASAAGKGLVNFTARARELGGELAVNSQPGKGTRVQLVFSLLIL
jgi:signal transduction histidine kinase